MANNDDIQLLSFNEDQFDLEQHKNAAGARTREVNRARRTDRKISLLRFLMTILALVVMFSLYYFINNLIVQYDYQKYHNDNNATTTGFQIEIPDAWASSFQSESFSDVERPAPPGVRQFPAN